MSASRQRLKVKTYLPSLKKILTDDQLTAVLERAEAYYGEYMQDIPKAEISHAKRIYTSASLYKALLQVVDRETAFNALAEGMYSFCDRAGHSLDIITRLPGFPSLFLRIFRSMTARLYGTAQGFEKEIIVSDDKEFRFNMTKCPYEKKFREAGFPELCEIACTSDIHTYGSLKRMAFIRTETLGTGGSCCDFCIRKR